MTSSNPALAVIDGSLCRLSRNGAVQARHQALATAVLEFLPGAMCLFVREHPYGLLPGVPNVYSIDSQFRLLWLAEWPLAEDPCARLVSAGDDTLVTESLAGVTVTLDAANGRVLRTSPRLQATG